MLWSASRGCVPVTLDLRKWEAGLWAIDCGPLTWSSLPSLSSSFQCTVLYVFYEIYSKYFMLLNGIVNGIAFLISFSDFTLLVNRNTFDFYMLILYSLTLLNLFIGSRRLFGFLGLFRNLILSLYSETSHDIPWPGPTWSIVLSWLSCRL